MNFVAGEHGMVKDQLAKSNDEDDDGGGDNGDACGNGSRPSSCGGRSSASSSASTSSSARPRPDKAPPAATTIAMGNARVQLKQIREEQQGPPPSPTVATGCRPDPDLDERIPDGDHRGRRLADSSLSSSPRTSSSSSPRTSRSSSPKTSSEATPTRRQIPAADRGDGRRDGGGGGGDGVRTLAEAGLYSLDSDPPARDTSFKDIADEISTSVLSRPGSPGSWAFDDKEASLQAVPPRPQSSSMYSPPAPRRAPISVDHHLRK